MIKPDCFQLLLALALVCAWAPAPVAVAGEKWPDERTAGLFACHADFTLDRHQALLDELGLLARDVESLLETPTPQEPVHLFLFEKKATYQAYLKHYFPRVPYRRALYIKGRGPGMVFAYQGLDFEIDVRHEGTHAVLHAALGSVPLWLDEGLAEYFEVPRDQRADKHPHQAAIEALVKSGRLPRLAELESMRDLSAMGRDEYRDAWAWVHFMLHGPAEAREELVAFLKDVQANADAEPLSRRFLRRMPDVEQRLREHFLAR
ncbi:MAG TPA: DUF1570 domain-containing protein [Pirellulaceae bacterium]|nr:DUF1570 domain-containing protein [Pirellulaceae bacterium]